LTAKGGVDMALTDKEIALELTKAYLEHLNVRVSGNKSHSFADAKLVIDCYKHFYKTVSEVDDSTKKSNE
jgi:hypothetical protein